MALLLRHEEIAGLLTMDDAIAAVRDGLAEQAAGQVQVPPRITIDSTSKQGWLRVMPAILNGSGIMGYKAMNATPGTGVRYQVALYDLSSGALLAFLDADALTEQRTAATAAVGTDLLAKPGPQRVGMFGSGGQARMLLTAISRIRPLADVRVFSPTPANREAFAAEMSQQLGVPVVAVASGEAAAADRDLVASAIRPGTTPVLHAEWLAPGTHVTAIGAVRPEAREVADGVWRQAAVVAVDERTHVFESGDGRSALASGSIQADAVAELWELVGGQRRGRQRPDDYTLFKSVGIALQDLCLAHRVYLRARERGLGQDFGEFPHVRK